jgi:DNA replication and repair protein RecF
MKGGMLFSMKLQTLHLKDFKNYSSLEIDLSEKSLLILVGDNGQGKTNILESIVVLALSKSFTGRALKTMVNWNLDEAETGLPEIFRITGTVETQKKKISLDVMSGKTRKYPKTLKVDDLKTKPKDYVGQLRIVLFTPQDLNMIMLAPQLRRRYVNILISQIDPDYLDRLSQYQVILKHRNKLLSSVKEGRAKNEELDYWDFRLVEHGAYLLWKRREVFQALNKKLSTYYKQLSKEENDLQLIWKKSWDYEDLESLQVVFLDYLSEKRSRDIEAESTCGGPHREDFFFQMHKMPLNEYGSRGECRSAVLALKLSELDYMTNLTGDAPIVLFDDVFSELDLHRQRQLLDLFKADQVIITTTHLDYELEGASVMKVDKGKVTELKH